MTDLIIHIGYGDSAAGCLRAAIKIGLPGDQVVVSRDDFTQGPISECIEDGGLKQRVDFWSNIETLHPSLKDVHDQYSSTLKNIQNIERKTKIVLWIGDSAHDQIATAWIITYLQNKDLDWHQVDLKIVESKVVNLAMLSPEQVVELYSNLTTLSSGQEQDYINLWKRVSDENTAFRMQNEDEIISVDQNFYDAYILSHLTKKDQFLGKLLGSIMGNSDHRLTDVTIESRLVALQSQKKIKIQSNLANIFLSKVRIK